VTGAAGGFDATAEGGFGGSTAGGAACSLLVDDARCCLDCAAAATAAARPDTFGRSCCLMAGVLPVFLSVGSGW